MVGESSEKFAFIWDTLQIDIIRIKFAGCGGVGGV